MRRIAALLIVAALLVQAAGLVQANEGPTAARDDVPRAFGRFLIGQEGIGAIGWVTIDVSLATAQKPDLGLFKFEALPGVAGYPVSNRAAIFAADFYREPTCCGNPASVTMWGVEVLYFVDGNAPWAYGRDFMIGLYDVGPEGRNAGDFFRWGVPTDSGPDWQEYQVVSGNLSVDLGSLE